ncbi:hypothetical protein [Alkaliphilus sp. B6464]|uniref:hypothetical protein n=1 Tax=Alkaliphilus sp. B6464 TaxID=2731219 RepID=UPI001BA69D39|nr:hypothetical protein [Alkaliphilus sp. B6464]QUH22199.1 hypothetical protein HYG84_20035 [Alkaliphilus sp. B6464]
MSYLELRERICCMVNASIDEKLLDIKDTTIMANLTENNFKAVMKRLKYHALKNICKKITDLLYIYESKGVSPEVAELIIKKTDINIGKEIEKVFVDMFYKSPDLFQLNERNSKIKILHVFNYTYEETGIMH